MKTDTLNISGMTCGGCSANVTRALSSVPGVAKVDVTLATKTAEVTFDEAQVSIDGMRGALRAAGYDLSTPGAASPRDT